MFRKPPLYRRYSVIKPKYPFQFIKQILKYKEIHYLVELAAVLGTHRKSMVKHEDTVFQDFGGFILKQDGFAG